GLVSLLVRGWGVTPLPGPIPSPSSPAGSVPTPAPSAPTVIGELTAGPRAVGGGPGHLGLDFEHPRKSGPPPGWGDEEMVLEEKLAARVSKKALMFNYSKGNLAQTLDVSPGHHTIRAQVTWEDNDKTESIVGTFKAGTTRRLEVRLGRIRKNLSLEW